jgi:hypothetical protein
VRTTVIAVLAIVTLSAGQQTKTFAGTVSDDMCARADHSGMRMGSNDAECTNACVSAHGTAYVLFDGKSAYKLSGSQPFEKFAGQKARVVGTLDAKTRTIRVESITQAE